MDFLRSIDPVWISLGPIVAINFVLLISLLYFLTTKERYAVPPEVQTRYNSKFLSGTLKHWWYWTNTPIAEFFVKMRMTPNILTFIGFLMSLVAAFFYAKGLFGYAGWIMMFGATFDLFDGQVARLTGNSTRSGAFFDSVMDRFGEGIVLLGLAFCFRSSWVLFFVLLSMIGSTGVSYTRARGESVGVLCKKGSMQRPERIVYLGCASIFQPMTDYLLSFVWPLSPPVLVIGALILIAVMSNITSVYRMIFIMNAIDSQDRKNVETLPQRLSKLTSLQGR